MNTRVLFHGTSTESARPIMRDGFRLGAERFDNWFAVRGISLSCNRSTLATRFAMQRSRLGDRSDPIVLEVPVTWPSNERILDLTTDEGMSLLFCTYREMRQMLARPRLGDDTPKEYRDYYDSLHHFNESFITWLGMVVKTSESSRVNFDAVANQRLVDELGIQVIVAVVQEGDTLHLTYEVDEPTYNRVPDFHGIRLRDHIEVTITDTDVIDHKSIRVYDHQADHVHYDSDFVTLITLPYGRDKGSHG